MKWKLIFQLSMLGLIMAFGTVSLIPEKIEFAFWVPIFIIIAYMIAKVLPGSYFVHGFMVSMFNSVYITFAHTLFYTAYMNHHPSMVKLIGNGPEKHVVVMVLVGIVSGILFGVLQGLFAFVASRFVKPTVS